ncbi:MAG: hypothetical protein JO202_04730 [Ktedonobacteraceae bacterium]|nr:hypothetical protein [Ktedonobacteraceae bacterium]
MDIKNSKKNSKGSKDVVDLELKCIVCRTQLYLPVSVAGQVIATVQSGGVAVLLCPYGHVQYLRREQQMYDC